MKMLPKLAEIGIVFPEDGAQRRLPGRRARRFFAVRFSDFAMLAAGRRALHHLADGDHEKSRNRQAQRRLLSHAGFRRAHAPGCTGRRRSTAPSISAARGRRTGRARLMWPWRWAPIRPRAWPAFCRFRRIWMNFCFPAFCDGNRSSWCDARRLIWKFPRMPRSCSKGYVDLGEMRTEGPFGDHTGFYSLEGQYPGVPCHLHHAPEGSPVSDHHRRAAAARRLFHRPRDRACVSCQ